MALQATEGGWPLAGWATAPDRESFENAQKCGPCDRGQKGWKMENVRIRLFKDNSRYKGDLFVSVNGVNYKIRRGVEVEVPPEVAEVLEHSQQQDERTAARIAAAEMSDT